MQSSAKTVDDYLAGLPPERRDAIAAVRQVILENLPPGYREGMQYGMIGYYIPLERYPVTYNKQPLGLAALASQKQGMSLYLMTVYGNPQIEGWFRNEFKKAGKRLDMGKSCVRFRKLEDLPLPVIGETIARVSVDEYIGFYEAARANTKTGARQAAAAKRAAGKGAAGKSAAGKPAKKAAGKPARKVAAKKKPRAGAKRS